MKKGFTLIELTGTIIILGLVVIIAYPILTGLLKSDEQQVDSATLAILSSASDIYIENNSEMYPITEENVFCLLLQNLVDENVLKYPIKNTYKNQDISLNKYMKVQIKQNDFRDYSLVDTCEAKINKQYLMAKDLIEEANNICDVESKQGCLENSLNKVNENNRIRNAEYYNSLDYIYMGVSPNNYLVFSGEGTTKSCFSILGIDNQKNIKIIYEGSANYLNGKYSCERKIKTQAHFKTSVFGASSFSGTNIIKNILNNLINASNLETKTYLENLTLTPADKLKINKSQFYVGSIYSYNENNNLFDVINDERTSVIESYIGLMNVSDIIKASFNPLCKKLFGMNSDYGNVCNEKNYLYNELDSWTINNYSNNNVYIFNQNGAIKDSLNSMSYQIRPVLYLKNSVKFTGDGTKTNPYVVES